MAPTKNTNRDRRSPIDQLEDPKCFKMAKRCQVDDNDDEEDAELMNTKVQRSKDKDYVQQQQNSYDDAPVVVNTQTSKSSAKHCVAESEDEVGYEEHSKTTKKLIHLFSGSGR
jgi:hypothetical protein